MRVLTGLLVLMAIPAAAQERSAVEEWLLCAHDKAAEYSASNEGADVVADAALGACRAQEEAVRQEIARIFGNDPDQVGARLRELRGDVKLDLISAVLDRRISN